MHVKIVSCKNSMEVLTSKTLIDSNISHDEFVLINDDAERILWYEGRNSKL